MNKIGELMIGVSIFSMAILIIFWYGYLKIDKYNHKSEIDNYVSNINDDKSYGEYYGYIKFPNYNIERLIKRGNPNKVIEEGYIGIYGYESDLIEPLILVGHSRENLFSILHKVSKNDFVEIVVGNNIYRYIIVKIKVIEVDDYLSLNKIDNKQIGLITCLEDNSKRLLVIGQMI